MTDKWQIFVSLPSPSRSGFYTAERGTNRFRVGRSHANHPALLIEFSDYNGASTPRRLTSISYTPPTNVDLISEDGTQREAKVAVLECRSLDVDLCRYFFRIVDALLIQGDQADDEASFESALDATITLFRSLQQPGSRVTQGLWAELAIILWAKDPSAALSSWHSNQRNLHDFSAGSFHLEVKSTRKTLREHGFSMDQLSTLSSGVTLIASLMLRESDSGASVFDLVDAINTRVGRRESASRLEAIVAECLGAGWRDASDHRFSLEEAKTTMALYRCTQIPTLPQPIPPEVKNIRFTVDLSRVPQVSAMEARGLGDLFRALLA